MFLKGRKCVWPLHALASSIVCMEMMGTHLAFTVATVPMCYLFSAFSIMIREEPMSMIYC